MCFGKKGQAMIITRQLSTIIISHTGIHNNSKLKFKANDDFWKRREEEFRAIEEEEKSYWEERGPPIEGPPPPMGPYGFGPPGAGGGGGPPPPPLGPQYLMRPETIDDRHVGAKHRDVYPSEEALSFIQRQVSHVEKALKLVSDLMVMQQQQRLQVKNIEVPYIFTYQLIFHTS